MSVVHRRPAPLVPALVALAAAFVLSLGGAPRARADEPAPAPAPKPAEPTLGDDLSVPDVLRNLARITGVSITWSDQDKGVTSRKILNNSGAIFRTNPDALFDAVRALLANDEIVLLPYGATASRMYRAMDARTLQSQFIVKMQPDVIEVTDEMVPTLLGQGGRFVTTTLRVRHLTELRDARAALQRLITQNNVGSIQEVPATRAFIVTDFAPNVAAIYRMVRQMDVPPAPAPTTDAGRTALSSFSLAHARAQNVAVVLQQLFPAKPAGPSAPARSAAEAPSPSAPSTPAPRIAYDEDTHQILVIATAEDTAAIREVIARMDVLALPRK